VNSDEAPLQIDRLGIPLGWRKGSGDWAGAQAAIDRQESIQVIQEAGSTLWQADLPERHSFRFDALEPGNGFADAPQARVWISPIQRRFAPVSDFPKVQWHPAVLWIGVGCGRGIARSTIELAVQEVCRSSHLAEAAIAGLATIDTKATEAGLLDLCRDRRWALRLFTAEALRTVAVPTPSSAVDRQVGTPSVAEAAALLASGTIGGAEDIDLHASTLRVFKTILRFPDLPGAVAIAIAQADREFVELL
jgi:cobalt-precorrin 5A hydrolase / precorrin-3B C17-methyltransferase